ncbi:MAG: hypothetical protein ACD_22C00256G0022 [uncultured bacterium]|nr:MAG: hypothetical protein ACD_22C00256G0022 [uncultured bacterium]
MPDEILDIEKYSVEICGVAQKVKNDDASSYT